MLYWNNAGSIERINFRGEILKKLIVDVYEMIKRVVSTVLIDWFGDVLEYVVEQPFTKLMTLSLANQSWEGL